MKRNIKEYMRVEITCKYCNFTFKEKIVLNDHMTYEHSQGSTSCHIKFRSNKRLKEHKHHSNIKHSGAI